jgi:hypothetical protein
MVFFIACKEEDTNPLLDENGLTSEITDLVPQKIIDEMKALGMPITGGGNPPLIEGTYTVTPYILLASNRASDILGNTYSDLIITFSSQNNASLKIVVDYENGQEEGSGIGSFIVGNGCSFSAFINMTSVLGGHPSKVVMIVSGNAKKNGIEKLYVAVVMVDDYGDPLNVLIENGEGRVFKDGNLFSEKTGASTDWYAALPNCPCEYTDQINGTKELCGTWKNCGVYSDNSHHYHYGASFELRWVPEVGGGVGQQCTYDSNRRLITGGLAAGTPDKVSPGYCSMPGLNVCEHYKEDVLPWGDKSYLSICLANENNIVPCTEYLERWPPNNGLNCQPNVVNGINHLTNMLGNMNCSDVALLFDTILQSQIASQELRDYIKGRLNYTPLTLRSLLMEVYLECNCTPSSEERRCIALKQALDNL